MNRLFEYFLERRRAKLKEESDFQKYLLCGMALQNGVCQHNCCDCAFNVAVRIEEVKKE